MSDTISDNPAFCINEVLSSFTNLVPHKNWELLKESCYNRNDKNCEEYCKNNCFLKSYCQFEIIKNKNRNKALCYLDSLKYKAILTGDFQD